MFIRKLLRDQLYTVTKWIQSFQHVHTVSGRDPTAVVRLQLKRKIMYVQRNIQAISCKYCYSGKAISMTYSVCYQSLLFYQPKYKRIALKGVLTH